MGFLRQLASLLRKNFLLKLRAPVEWAAEVLLPIAFVAIMLAIFFAFSPDNFPNRNYANPPSGSNPVGPQPVPPFAVVPFRVLYRAQRIAVAAATPDQQPLVDDFVATMSAWHPRFAFSSLGADAAWGAALAAAAPKASAAGVASLVLPGFADAVLKFPSADALNAYVTSKSYDSGWLADAAANPKIFAAIIFSGGANAADGGLNYAIRMNSSVTANTNRPPVDPLARGVVLKTLTGYLATTLVSR